MPRPTHFEIPADDTERAVAFYEQVFGWKIEKWEGPTDYWLITTGEDEPGINGGLGKRSDPDHVPEFTMDVDDLDAFIEKVEAGGGKLLREKYRIPGVGWFAYCLDSEGNRFGMMQSDQ